MSKKDKSGSEAPTEAEGKGRKKSTRKSPAKKVIRKKAPKKVSEKAGPEAEPESAPAEPPSRPELPEASAEAPAGAEAPESLSRASVSAGASATPEASAPPTSRAESSEGPIAKAVREQIPPEGARGPAAGLLSAGLALLGSAGVFLWSAPRRPYTIAIGAALLLVFGWQLGGEDDDGPGSVGTTTEAGAPVVRDQPKLSEEARLQIAAGDPLGAARRLESEVTRTDRSGGDAKLHAALAHAYAQAGWGSDAVPHFEWTARKDPSALQEQDLRDLVRLLGLPGAKPEAVQATLITAGRRSVPILEEVWEDERAPVLVRRRAGEVLQRLGEEVALIPLYRALLARGACPARKEAVARLAAATDDAAADLLQEVATSERCGAAEARRALGQ